MPRTEIQELVNKLADERKQRLAQIENITLKEIKDKQK